MILNIIVALLLPLVNLSAQIMVKYILSQHKDIKSAEGLAFTMQLLSIPGIWAVAAFQFLGFVLWGFVISRLQLGVANAAVGSFYYLFSALAGMFFFGEMLSLRQWAAIGLISAGALLLLSEGYA